MEQDRLYSSLSYEKAPDIKVIPPGPISQEILGYQDAHESSAVSYPKGMPMALEAGRGRPSGMWMAISTSICSAVRGSWHWGMDIPRC